MHLSHSSSEGPSPTLEVTRLDMHITRITRVHDSSVNMGQVGAVTGSLIILWGQKVYTQFLTPSEWHVPHDYCFSLPHSPLPLHLTYVTLSFNTKQFSIASNVPNNMKLSTIQWHFIYAQQSKKNIYNNYKKPYNIKCLCWTNCHLDLLKFCRNTKMWSHGTLNATRT